MDMTSENAELSAIVERYRDAEGGLLPALRDIQNTFGHISDAAKRQCAEVFNLSRAEVHGVASFYHDFRSNPSGRHVLKICRAEACQSVGANALAQSTLERLGIDWNGTTSDGNLTVEPVYCLGLCACGPAAMLDGKVAGRLDTTRMNALLGEVGA